MVSGVAVVRGFLFVEEEDEEEEERFIEIVAWSVLFVRPIVLVVVVLFSLLCVASQILF